MRRKITSICMAGVLLASLLTGCAQNPASVAVSDMGGGTFDQKLNTVNRESFDREEIQNYQSNFTVENGNLTVAVDAEVTAIQGNVPVMRVTPHEITVEDVKAWADVLFEGNQAYDRKHVWTKAEIEAEIRTLKGYITSDFKTSRHFSSEGKKQEYIAKIKDEIALWEKQYADAPDTASISESEWYFRPSSYYDENSGVMNETEIAEADREQRLEITANTENGEAIINATNRDESDYIDHSINFFYSEDNLNLLSVEMTEEEAAAQAEKIAAQLGMGEWEIADIKASSSSESCYTIYFAPVYDGYESLYVSETAGIVYEADDYGPGYTETELDITIDNGVVTNCNIHMPMDLAEMENDNIETLPFDEVCAAFETYAKSELAGEANGRSAVLPDTISISKIEQKLFRMKVKGESDASPCFVFVFTAIISRG